MARYGPETRLLFAFFLAILVFSSSGLVFAADSDEESGCMFSPLTKAIGKLRGQSSGGDETTGETISCPSPYMESNGECCLDHDGNGVCDSDESATDTTLPEPTTTTEAIADTTTSTAPQATATTAEPATTTTVKAIACAKNSDCGNETFQNVCADGNLYTQQLTPTCNNPGRPLAKCIVKTKLVGQTGISAASPTERCSRGCRNGACL